jgi:hypothetical protein
MTGLLDPEHLEKHTYEEKNAGPEGQFAGAKRRDRGERAACGQANDDGLSERVAAHSGEKR